MNSTLPTQEALAPNNTPETGQQLRNIIEKIEALEEEKKELMRDIREAFQDAKAQGFEPKVMRQVLKFRKMKREEFLEQEMLLDTYFSALGMSRG